MRISSEINELGSLRLLPSTSPRYCVRHLLQSHLQADSFSTLLGEAVTE